MNRIHQILLFALALGFSKYVVGQTKPVCGTWINLPYQDVRNKYMNPLYIDHNTAEFWGAKIQEQADLGIKYIVIMAVANEGKSYYPSSYMEAAYDATNKSPVDAILETASKNGMKVFMSSGWAVDQDDNLKDPKIRAMQIKIMEEIAGLYKCHAAFYGWYLPVEDSMEPILSDHAVDAVNFLTQKARSLTPDKVIMISPYGICNAELDNPAFARQIKRLNVDIIAYQDEVGCVREPQPLPRMKENFKKLGEIHKGTNIQFWANVESFTWEEGDNSRESALIPAAFPRYLAQMTAATEAGAAETISFSTYGIYEKANSLFPIGQPTYSNLVTDQYNDWRSGRDKWKLLESTFKNAKLSTSKIKTVLSNGKQHTSLYNGVFAEENSKDDRWVRLGNDQVRLTISLSGKQKINSIALRFLNYKPDHIALPQFVHLSVIHNNGVTTKVKTIQLDQFPNNRFDAWVDLALFNDLRVETDKVQVDIDAYEGQQIYCDEILINPKY